MSNTSLDVPPGFTLRHTLRGHSEEINRIAWSPDGRFLTSSSFDKTVRIWDAQTGEMRVTLTDHSGAVYSVTWSPDGRLLASCSQDRQIMIWDLQSGRSFPQPLRQHPNTVYDLEWLLHSSLYLTSCSLDQTINIWEIDLRTR